MFQSQRETFPIIFEFSTAYGSFTCSVRSSRFSSEGLQTFCVVSPPDEKKEYSAELRSSQD